MTTLADGEPFDKRAWNKGVGWLLTSLTVVVGVHAVWPDLGRPPAVEETSSYAVPALPRVSPLVVDPAPAPVAGEQPRSGVPHVGEVLRADFTAGAPWPVSAAARDTRSVSWPMGVVGGVFVHGPSEQGPSASWLERWLRTDVRVLGARVRFAPERSGSVAITAWHTSVLEASGTALPRTGMRLVASPGRWRVEVVDRRRTTTLDSGRYVPDGPSATFELLREGRHLWVVDPAGTVTRLADPRVTALAGPWVSWELREGSPRSVPAALEEIWAG